MLFAAHGLAVEPQRRQKLALLDHTLVHLRRIRLGQLLHIGILSGNYIDIISSFLPMGTRTGIGECPPGFEPVHFQLPQDLKTQASHLLTTERRQQDKGKKWWGTRLRCRGRGPKAGAMF